MNTINVNLTPAQVLDIQYSLVSARGSPADHTRRKSIGDQLLAASEDDNRNNQIPLIIVAN